MRSVGSTHFRVLRFQAYSQTLTGIGTNDLRGATDGSPDPKNNTKG
jgi:hypothetical protein